MAGWPGGRHIRDTGAGLGGVDNRLPLATATLWHTGGEAQNSQRKRETPGQDAAFLQTYEQQLFK